MINLEQEVILVTGGAGFIGSHTVDELLRKNHFVIIIDNFSTGDIKNLNLNIKNPNLYIIDACIIKDLDSSFDKILDKFQRIDRIIHLAAQTSVIHSIKHPIDDAEINYRATIKLLEKANSLNVKKFIFASSAAVYGEVHMLPIQEHHKCAPVSPYGINKLSSEKSLYYFWKVHQLPTESLRFFNVYGPRQNPHSPYSGVISKFLDKAINSNQIEIYGDGQQTRDFIYVKDVASTIINLLFHPESSGEAYNLGTGKETNIKDLSSSIIELTKSNSEIIYQASRSGEIEKSLASIQKIETFLGKRHMSKLEQGLKETITWFKKELESSTL